MIEVSDYIVIGGGTAGCIVAARLSEDPSIRVTLLEAGPDDLDPWIHIPAGYAKLAASRKYDWKFSTEQEPELRGRNIYWPRGRVLGGTGSINGLIFLRGSPPDYDRWAAAGASGWSYEDVLPWFKRIEDWTGAPNAARGKGGPVTISEPRSLSRGASAFVAAVEAAGLRRNADFNVGEIEGVAAAQMNVRNGRRRSSSQAYLRPARKRPNLRVVTGVTVDRLIVENDRATGCIGRHAGAAPQEYRARREIILCAGAIATPKILMLSGIGDGAALRKWGLPVVLDRPGVGQNLQDHFLVRYVFKTLPIGTLNERTATWWRMAGMAVQFALSRSGPMAIGATEATAFAKVMPDAEEADVQYQFVNFRLPGEGNYILPKEPGFMISFGQCRPESRGHVTLRSPDPEDKPAITANYITAKADQEVMIAGAKLAKRFGQTAPLSDIITEQLQPRPEISSDEDILDYIRNTGTTVFHPCGTCRMGGDDAAVVDPKLRLRGIRGLRVADASIMPFVTTANIQAPVMMIAERAAAFIREDANNPAL